MPKSVYLLALAVVIDIGGVVYAQNKVNVEAITAALSKNNITVTTPKEMILAGDRKFVLDKDYSLLAKPDTNIIHTQRTGGIILLKPKFQKLDSLYKIISEENPTFAFSIEDTLKITEQTISSIQETLRPDARPIKRDISNIEGLVIGFPNPTNGRMVISCDVPRAGKTYLQLFNLLGQLAFTKDMGNVEPGRYYVPVAAGSVSSGLYFARLIGEGFAPYSSTTKVVLLKQR